MSLNIFVCQQLSRLVCSVARQNFLAGQVREQITIARAAREAGQWCEAVFACLVFSKKSLSILGLA
jgi:hypothetical protein